MTNLIMRRPNLLNLPSLPDLPPGYALRDFRDSDTEQAAALMRAAFSDESWTPDQFRKLLSEAPDVLRTVLIEHDGKPVATASAQVRPETYPGSGALHWVAVDPLHRGMRLGYIVSLAVLHELADRGFKDAVLETQDERLPAIRTYQKLGFAPEHADESHANRWSEVMTRLLAAINL